MEKIILLVDNDKGFLSVYARLLEQEGYRVYQAGSVIEGETILDSTHIHLLICDIRLEDDDDDQDISGLLLVEKKKFSHISKLMLTSFPSWDYARRVLGAKIEDTNILDLLNKADGPLQIIDKVNDAFKESINVNWNLKICWQSEAGISVDHLLDLSGWKQSGAENNRLLSEFKELLCRLFHAYEQVNLYPVFSEEAKLVMKAFAFTQGGEKRREFVVSCGMKSQMQQEALLSETHELLEVVKALDVIYTRRFTAIAYFLRGATLEEITSLKQFILLQTSLGKIDSVFKHLFTKRLAFWHTKSRSQTSETWSQVTRRLLNLKEEDSLIVLHEHMSKIVDLAHLFGFLSSFEISDKDLCLQTPNIKDICLPNPLLCLSDVWGKLTISSQYGLIHGKLNGQNLFIDETTCHTWIAGFGQFHQMPLLVDYVMVELAIKLDVLPLKSIDDFYKFEQQLLEIEQLDQEISMGNMDINHAKLAVAINQTRKLAVTNVEATFDDYLKILLICTLRSLLTFDSEKYYTKRELLSYFYPLISAALICQKLNQTIGEQIKNEVSPGLVIDIDSRRVWVNGEELQLTAQELQLLLYLYQNLDKVCSREDILRDVLNSRPYKDESSTDMIERESPRINSLVSRLRKKIEPNQDVPPRYLLSIRGIGYRLALD